MKPHKHADAIHAWANGNAVEVLTDQGSWAEVKNPSWAEHCEYRVKLKVKPDFVLGYKVQSTGDNWHLASFQYMPICTEGNLVLIFDGETGELKSAEMVRP